MRFLAISSHVVHGHVGNAALVFPLQRLGVEVLPLHTVVYSNHLGYPRYAGRAVPAGEVLAIVDCLAETGLLAGVGGVLSGFLGEAGTADAVVRAVKAAKAADPQALYCCDPVMGDDGKLYVSNQVARAVREKLLPLADLLTPNRYELSVLTDRPVGNRAEIRAAAASLLPRAKAVLVTSASTAETRPGEIDLMLVTPDGAFLLSTPWLNFDIVPNGAGDIVAALFLYYLRRDGDARAAAEAAVSSLFAVLETSAQRGGRELALVAAQAALVAPRRRFTACQLE